MSATAIEDGLRIAVLLPCHNHAATIGAMVRGFADAIPSAIIYVFDNNSTDDTAREATRAGAHVRRESRPGKGSVVRRMFADIEADVYVLADPSDQCDPADAPSLVYALITERVDMVVGTRGDERASVFGMALPRQPWGRRAFDWCYRRYFGDTVRDIGSSYRAFSRRFVKSFPAISKGFDVEIELSIHASQLMMSVAEIKLTDPQALPKMSPAVSFGDGLRALGLAAALLRDARPFVFYAAVAICFWTVGLFLMTPRTISLFDSDFGPTPAGTFLGPTMLLAGFVFASCGLILDALRRSRIEQKRTIFLAVPSLGAQ
jgi:glycosyltransferase involved in cell wall biosynthesis